LNSFPDLDFDLKSKRMVLPSITHSCTTSTGLKLYSDLCCDLKKNRDFKEEYEAFYRITLILFMNGLLVSALYGRVVILVSQIACCLSNS
jgi:hypothetical protein